MAVMQRDPWSASRQRFLDDTREHRMTVVRDDGLYRHLRVQRGDSSFYWYEVVTWPGYLAISGDTGCWVFSRTRDMFDFFTASGGINPDYWAQKLQAADARSGLPGGKSDGRRYDPETFEDRLRQWARDSTEGWGWHEDVYPSLLIGALEREVFGGWHEHGDYYSEEQARAVLVSLAEINVVSWDDVGEMDLREWDWSFLWCCWAIVWAIGEYRGQGG